jgi:hypothetical protein
MVAANIVMLAATTTGTNQGTHSLSPSRCEYICSAAGGDAGG